MTAAEVHALILSLPETEVGTSWGYPSYKTAGKFLTRLRTEDDSLVVHVPTLDHRDVLLEAEPATFHLTDHYRNYPIVLARIATVNAEWLSAMLVARWRTIASKKLRAAHSEL